MKRTVLLIVAIVAAVPLLAQRYPERRLVRVGNKQYERTNYVESEVAYRRALEKNAGSYEAADNLGKTLYKQGRYEEAAQIFGSLGADSLNRQHAPSTFYDLGNAMFQQRKLKEAMEAYKQSLRLNPGDMEAKFNLAYVQKLLNENQGAGGGNNDQNQDQNQQNQPQQGQGKPEPKDGKPKQGEGGMSEQEAQHILEAMQMNEDKTRDKMDEKKGQAPKRGGKNW